MYKSNQTKNKKTQNGKVNAKLNAFDNFDIKLLVEKFNFADPNWDLVPENIHDIKKNNLSRYQKHLLDAIILAWMTTRKGKKTLYTNALKTCVLTFSLVFILHFGVSAVKNLEGNHAKSVNAATISATLNKIAQGEGMEIVESTMSAMFNKER